MKTTDEIQSAIGNISYYADRIEALTKEQYNYDCDNCETILNMTNRLDLLCVLAGATRGVSLLCEQMSNNLQHAIKAKTTIEEKLKQEVLL